MALIFQCDGCGDRIPEGEQPKHIECTVNVDQRGYDEAAALHYRADLCTGCAARLLKQADARSWEPVRTPNLSDDWNKTNPLIFGRDLGRMSVDELATVARFFALRWNHYSDPVSKRKGLPIPLSALKASLDRLRAAAKSAANTLPS